MFKHQLPILIEAVPFGALHDLSVQSSSLSAHITQWKHCRRFYTVVFWSSSQRFSEKQKAPTNLHTHELDVEDAVRQARLGDC